MSIQSRIRDINAVYQSSFTREIYRRDKTHFVYQVKSEHNPDNQYQVIVTWTKQNNILTATTFLYSYEPQYENGNHPANNNGTIAYQVLGALKKAAKISGKRLAFCENYENAKRLLNLGGELIAIKNQVGSTVWAVIK